MLLKEYLESLNKLVNKDKTLLDCRVIYANDDEGNGYQVVSNTAEVFFLDKDESTGCYIDQIYDEVDIAEYKINAERILIIN